VRIFEQFEKVNFVDSNNVFVGYGLGQDCCEYADWFIDTKIHDRVVTSIFDENLVDYDELKLKTHKERRDLKGFVFDKDFYRIIESKDNDCGLDAGGMAVFRIVKGEAEKFIHIFNCHNGYYAHGFEFGEKHIIQDGSL